MRKWNAACIDEKIECTLDTDSGTVCSPTATPDPTELPTPSPTESPTPSPTASPQIPTAPTTAAPTSPTSEPELFVSSGPLDWASAEDWCYKQSGHLVSIHGETEQAVAAKVCNDQWTIGNDLTVDAYGCWIGLHLITYDVWGWKDDTDTDFGFAEVWGHLNPTKGDFPWATSYPMGGNGGGCGFMVAGWGVYKWADITCDQKENYTLCSVSQGL